MKAAGLLSLLIAAPAAAEFVDVELLVYHAEADPVSGEPCGGAFAGPGLTTLNIFFDNIEFNARDEQETWPDRAFPRIEPGDGGTVTVRLEYSAGNPQFNIEPGIQSNYVVRIGWGDRDVLSSDRTVNLDPYRIVGPQRLYVTRNGWTTNRPGNNYAQHGVIICNRPPTTITTSALFEDIEPGSVFMGWRHTGGLGEARDWSRTEVYLLPQPEIPQFGAQPVFTQAAWGSTNRTVRNLDCGEYWACYRNIDHYGHVWEGCDESIMVENCVMEEPDMMPPEPDLGVDMMPPEPDLGVDMAVDMAPDMMPMLPDMAVMLPDMAVAMPDMSVAMPDMAVAMPDMAVAMPDMAVAMPDMSVAMPDMNVAMPDMRVPDPRMDMSVQPPPDMTVDMREPDPRVDMQVILPDAAGATMDRGPGDDAPEAGVTFDQYGGDGREGDPRSDGGVTGASGDTDDCATAPGERSTGWFGLLLLIGLGRRRR